MGLAERRQREKDRRRDEIIKAASRLFSEKGYEGVSMEEIANEVELSKSTLYFYFKDKDSLFFAILNKGNKIFRHLLAEEEEHVQHANINFGVLKAAWSRFILEYPEYARCRAYFRIGKFELDNGICENEDVKEILESSKECFEKGVQVIKIGIEKGTYKPSLNPLIITALYVLMYENLFIASPLVKNILDTNGITVQQFIMEAIECLDLLILNV